MPSFAGSRVQTKSGGTVIYHVSYERGSTAFFPDGSIALPPAEGGGAFHVTPWASLPAPVQTAALKQREQIGDVDLHRDLESNEGGIVVQ